MLICIGFLGLLVVCIWLGIYLYLRISDKFMKWIKLINYDEERNYRLIKDMIDFDKGLLNFMC